MKTPLKTRFEEFVKIFPGMESIDALRAGKTDSEDDRADYLAENRTLIIEQKSLEEDTESKIEKILKPHREREEFPHFFGEWDVSRVLKHLPDGETINARLTQALTTSVRAVFRKANNQIKFTKEFYGLPDAQGLLVILNEKIEVLTPETILYTLRKIAASKHQDGWLRYTEINAVLLISEAHVKQISKELLAHPLVFLRVDTPQQFRHEQFIKNLQTAWATFNKAPLIKDSEPVQSFKDLGFYAVSADKKAKRKDLPRQEAWARHYEANPYFRKFTDEWLRWLFGIMMVEIGKGMTKRSTPEQESRAQFFWMEVFTHFMEEVRHRAIDMRFFTNIEGSIGELNDEMKRRFPEDFEPPR